MTILYIFTLNIEIIKDKVIIKDLNYELTILRGHKSVF